ncbi:hypothetical protein PAAG_09023 [Paracoccidioides lutzii Pb01]|uniref:Protein kinase domain-containing protein n=1 Tax=Paracoccidioides lutzii (strain ATCC MYA-826 / Pb01) TaxID=502779 RepID=C1HE30_PARBA|nr:hypothetical protein PAAG_09023 [Paracoccidioides lutzii Pb01]EEH40570.2 hypothetical protein PAAG_09023 [Paracoccidioides lutzii Pb01]
MATGLTKEIRPAQDVIGQDSDDVDFCCKRLVAAATTQLFSYMVHKELHYSYICTGETFIFVYIPDDPSSVQCALCRPDLGVKVTSKVELQLTAVVQVLVFTIRALTSPAVPREWHDAAVRLDVWPVEYSEILEQTPSAAHPKHAPPGTVADNPAGSCGALFKVRLSSHGYTVVAKGVKYKHLYKLEHEKQIYDELRDLQGECIPVCLGIVQLALKHPYYYNGRIYTHMLFLSWVEEAIQKVRTLSHTADASSMVYHALQAIHFKGVLHGDMEL